MKGLNLEFTNGDFDGHYCVSKLDGDWIIWTCPICVGYERRLNWKTGDLVSNDIARNSIIKHSGKHVGEDSVSEPLAKNSNQNLN